MTTNNANVDNTDNARRADGAETADISDTGRNFISQLRLLMYHLTATERSRAIREGIARRRAQVIQTNTGGHHDQ